MSEVSDLAHNESTVAVLDFLFSIGYILEDT